MPNQKPVKTYRRRRLGVLLRSLRVETRMSLDDVAEAVGWNPTKLSRIENANATIRPADVTVLLRIYGVENQETFTALENLARDAGKLGWWQTYQGTISPAYADYIELEEDADKICDWSPLLIPGLLQTNAYARETLSKIAPNPDPGEAARLTEVRQARQAVLSRPDRPLQLHAVLHEAVLSQRITLRPSAMRDQLQRLLDVTDMPNVTLQVLPMQSPLHPGTAGGFSVVNFADYTPDVVLIENLRGNTYVEDADDVKLFASAFEGVASEALSTKDSIDIIMHKREAL